MGAPDGAEGSQEQGWYLVLPVALYLLLAVLYLFAIPVGESPDEPGHLQCIEQVARDRRLPVVDPPPEGEVWWQRERVIAGHMCYHMPLYYLVAGLAVAGLTAVSQAPDTFTFPPTNPRFGPDSFMFDHADKPFFWRLPEPVTLSGLRGLSIALGLLLVCGGYRLTRRLAPARPLAAVLAAVLVAGWPQLAYLSRAISNDALATALAVGTLLVLVEVGRPYRLVWAALLAALSVLTKISVSFTVLAVLATGLLELVVFREWWRRYVSALAGAGAIWLLTWLLLTRQPVLAEHLAQSGGAFAAVSGQVWTVVYWQEWLVLTLSSGWARLGWMNVPAPLWHAYGWWLLLGATAVIGVVGSWRHAETRPQKILVAVLLLWLAGVAAFYLRINLNRFQPQFRFMLALAPALAGFAALGMMAPAQRRRWQLGMIGGTAVALLGYNLWFIFTIVRAAYGWEV